MRKKIPAQVMTEVLKRCRRRCAICFGLERDGSQKDGQIAHLDRDSANNKLDNLVFLCLSHHDRYDSRTSQSKNLTMGEVRLFRRELEAYISVNWKQAVEHHVISLFDPNDISGNYYQEAGNATAELDIKVHAYNIVSVSGLALWGTRNEHGPNIGLLEFKSKLSGNLIHHKNPHSGYEITIHINRDDLTVTERNSQNEFGLNVSFEGPFIKASPKVRNRVIAEDKLTISQQAGNIFIRKDGQDKQLTFTGMDRFPVLINDGKILYIRQGVAVFEAGGIHSGPNFTNKIMTVHTQTLLEEIVTDRKPYVDGLDGTDRILNIVNPTLSTDNQHLYFVTEKWATSNQLVKVHTQSGKWTELFPAESFELITRGLYQDLFLVAYTEIRDRGRDIYYKLSDESGKPLKEFESEGSLLKFRGQYTKE